MLTPSCMIGRIPRLRKIPLEQCSKLQRFACRLFCGPKLICGRHRKHASLTKTRDCIFRLVQSRPRDWTRHQCVTVAQLHMGHSPLLPAYLHRIGRRDSATCVHCNGADETAEHLVLHCPAHESWPNLHYQSDPRRLWSFLEMIGVVTRPPDRE